MAQKVIIAGAEFPDVPAVNLAKSGGGTALFVDTSGDTVSAASMLSGTTAHDKAGNAITGTFVPSGKPEQTKTATANGTVYPDSGYVLSSVTVAIPYYDGTVVEWQ